MVCLSMDGPFLVMIKDEYGGATTSVVSSCGMIQLSSTKSIESIFSEICSQYKYSQDSIALILENRSGEKICLNDHKDKTLEQIGVSCGTSTHNSITIQALNKCDAAISSGVPPDNYSEYELQLGASASPTGAGVDDILPSSSCDPPPTLMSDDEYSETSRDISTSRHNLHRAVLVDSLNYVGLVNQAMTCYLNSLLQALYMTPEFRNALYNWEFDGQNEARSIPFQLQKLFLNLQTSLRSAVETTELTHSFGWQGSDAWQQHDIQELCRVMFDALEQKFKSTRQANLISELYEGKMLDYVRCLECGTEKSREDTFLDIPLPVRPFGASGAYASVEEALRAFVQPETLDGNNQYHCDTCRKKCDAHKGLKFTKFPYLLTLHLKRFDFDYNTLHRIKLNDKVVFPYKLNLNSFTHACDTAGSVHRGEGDTDPTRGVCDDCSTTDSGSALDDDTSCQGTDASGSSVVNGHDVDNCGGDSADEGIDVSSGGTSHETEASGPYLYELFSIMIHSGSASGGHYYAYIKDFDKNQWFCFNDQSVSRITEEDIRKTYGGGPARSFYTGAYTSSTNAYMLMYRQINKERNCRAISAENFPPHIQNLLKQMRHKEEQDRINREKENDMIKLTVYIIHPTDSTLRDARISVGMDWTLGEGAHSAYSRFQLENIVALEDCRLVTYNKFQECINMSYDNVDDVRFSDVRKSGLKRVSFRNAGAGNSDALVPVTNWMLEIRQPGTEWETYKEGGINMRVVPINIESEDVEEGFSVRVNMNETVAQLKHRIAAKLEADPSTLKLVMENVCKFSHDLKYLEQDDGIVDYDISDTYKLYVSNALDEDPAQNFENCRLRHLIERFKHVIMLNVMLPNTNTETLENLSIPSLELRENLDRLELASEGGNCSPPIRGSPQPPSSDGPSDQSNSNSEDSSLSDSDRTLVGDAPGESLAQLSPSSLSPGDHPMASPSDEPYRPTTGPAMGPAGEEMHWDDEDSGMSESTSTTSTPSYFFKVTLLLPNLRCARLCRILVDQRMTIEKFKKHLETFVTVPVDYFKVFSYTHTSEDECTNNSLLRLHKDGARLSVKLGRVLRKDEYNAKVYYLNIETSTEMTVLLEHIIAKGQTVEQVKKQIMYQAKKQHGLDLSPHKCRLREKSWKKPKLVFLDQQVFGDDIPLFKHFELILQELSEPEKVFNTDQVPIFTRQWHPATLTLGPYREVVFDNSTMTLESFKGILSDLEGIPVENLEVAYVKNNFPADMHVLEVDSELEWISTAAKDDEMYLGTDGHIFFFRDNREKPKELTADERKELNSKENKRLGRSIKSYSPGRERALKIYLDTSPCKTDYTD